MSEAFSNTHQNESSLPKGWASSSIADISIKCTQRKPNEDEEFIYVDIGSIDRELKRIATPQSLKGNEAPSRARKVINKGDVVVSLTRPNLNAVALVSGQLDGQIASTGFEIIKPLIVDSRYIFALTRSKDFIDSISGVVQGALYPAAKSTDVQKFEFPLPPLAEQKIIADKLDQLLAQVESTKARLDRIPDILKRFRQSVLAAAVSGKLTEEWRGESSYSMLQLPLTKREKSIDIPASWDVKELSKSCTVTSGNAFKSNEFRDIDGVPAIKISNVQYGEFEVKNQQYLPTEFLEKYSGFKVEVGDVLMALTRPITNDTLKVCRYPEGHQIGLLNQRVCKFLFSTDSEKDFFEILFQSEYFKDQVVDNLSETLQPNLSPKSLKSFKVAIPTTAEQAEIVSVVEQIFAYADKVEQQVNQAQERVNKLTQSILAKAFRGELTEQWRKDNPDLISGDNSAEALLEKIKAEREAAKPKKKTRKKAAV